MFIKFGNRAARALGHVMKTFVAVAVVAGTLALSSAAGAATLVAIPGLFNTGLDASGDLLAAGNGVIDPHYEIIASTVSSFAGGQAVTYKHPAYAAEDADSRWVSLSGDGMSGASNTLTTYRTTFSLAGLSAATASLHGSIGVDNYATVLLNGHEIFSTPTAEIVSNFDHLHDFSTVNHSYFVSGVNTIDIVVGDYGQPTAFRIDNLAGAAAVPEPAAWALMILGFGGVGAALRSQRRRVFAAA